MSTKIKKNTESLDFFSLVVTPLKPLQMFLIPCNENNEKCLCPKELIL